MARQWYRTYSALLNYTRPIYDIRNHPGDVPVGMNPFDKLNLILPKAKARLVVCPAGAISGSHRPGRRAWPPERGRCHRHHGLGRVRRQDWLGWAPSIFDTPFLTWDIERTDTSVTIPWSVIPELRNRIEVARRRHQQGAGDFLY